MPASLPRSIVASHAILVDLPVDRCQALFTPAGEELWVDGWRPRYLDPDDGRTTQGMVFLTGDADECTVWTLLAYGQHPHHARYLRVTPASRWGHVDVGCEAVDPHRTRVTVRYALHALNDRGAEALRAFEPPRFTAMIEGWKQAIDSRLDVLRTAVVR